MMSMNYKSTQLTDLTILMSYHKTKSTKSHLNLCLLLHRITVCQIISVEYFARLHICNLVNLRYLQTFHGLVTRISIIFVIVKSCVVLRCISCSLFWALTTTYYTFTYTNTSSDQPRIANTDNYSQQVSSLVHLIMSQKIEIFLILYGHCTLHK